MREVKVAEAAEVTGLSRTRVYRLIDEGAILSRVADDKFMRVYLADDGRLVAPEGIEEDDIKVPRWKSEATAASDPAVEDLDVDRTHLLAEQQQKELEEQKKRVKGDLENVVPWIDDGRVTDLVHGFLIRMREKDPSWNEGKDEEGWAEGQAGACPYFTRLQGAVGADWGVVLHPGSMKFGKLVFEHEWCGCAYHREEGGWKQQ